MPDAWTNKDQRMYQHVKDNEAAQGTGKERAKEIAAKTVNKHRREAGRTPNSTTQGTGNPNTRLESRTVAQLRNRAAELDVSGRSKMNKRELIDAIRRSS